MKKLLLTAALTLIATPATAGQIMPNLYAREFCSMRDLGVSADEARAAAVASAYVESLPDLPKVTIAGDSYAADVVQAYRAVQDRCPQHL